MAVASFAVSAASTVSGFMGQKEMYEQNAKNANESARRQYFDSNMRILQEKQAAALNKSDVTREARAATATARVAAGEAGVSGNSVDALLSEFMGRADDYKGRVNTQTDWSIAQINREKLGIQAQAKDRINSVQRPSFLDAGLRILGAGMDSYGVYQDQKIKQKQMG
jgi:hypothetical protein